MPGWDEIKRSKRNALMRNRAFQGEYEDIDPDVALGTLEAPLVIGSAVAAEPVAGWNGLIAAGAGRDPVEAIEKTREKMTYGPRSESLQAGLAGFGQVAEDIGKGLVPAREAYESVMNPIFGPEFAGGLYAALAAGASIAPIPGIAALKRLGKGKAGLGGDLAPAPIGAMPGETLPAATQSLAETNALAAAVLPHDEQAGARAAVATNRMFPTAVTNIKDPAIKELLERYDGMQASLERAEQVFKENTGFHFGQAEAIQGADGKWTLDNPQAIDNLRRSAFKNGLNPDGLVEKYVQLRRQADQFMDDMGKVDQAYNSLATSATGDPMRRPAGYVRPKQRGSVEDTGAGKEILKRQTGRNALASVEEIASSRPAPQDMPPVNVKTPGAKVGTMDRRVGTTGKYRGAPREIDSPQKLRGMRDRLKQSLVRGIPGRNWYDRSSKAAVDLTAGREGLRDRYVGGIAVTSADTAVPSNAGFAIKGYNQLALGDEVWTGRYPQRMSENLSAINRGDEVMLTDKVGPFWEANRLDPNIEYSGRPTNDLWMARAFGYTQANKKMLQNIELNKRDRARLETEKLSKKERKKLEDDIAKRSEDEFVEWGSGLGEAQHRFMDEEINSLVEWANKNKIGGYDDWTPERVQASIWVDTKARREGTSIDSAKTDFATDLQNRTISIASESTPATSLDHLTGVTSTTEGRNALFEAQNRLLTDDQGRDVVAVHANALTRPSVQGHGIYADDINPVTKTQILGGTETGSQVIDSSSERLARGIGAVHGLVKGQETVAVKFLRPADEAGLRNSLRVDMGQPIDKDSLASLQKALDEQFGEGQVIADFHENGVDLLAINLDDAGSVAIKPVGERLAAQGSATNAMNVNRPAALTKSTNALHEALGLKPKTGTKQDGFPDKLPKDWQQEAEQVVLRELDAIDAMDARDNTAVRTGKGPAPGLVGAFGEYKPSEYLKEIDAAGAQFGKNIDPLVRWAGRAFEEVDDFLSKAIPNAGQRNKILQMTRQALAEGGLDRVRELVRQGVLPAVVLGVFAEDELSGRTDPGAA